MRSVYGDHERFVQTYFSAYRGKYFTGDGCRRDEDGYYWITGRVDDVLNVSGHRLGTAEIESALVSHPARRRGGGGRLSARHQGPGHLLLRHPERRRGGHRRRSKPSCAQQVRTEISAIATPDLIHFTPALPKTRSGKIMRRILRKIAENDYGALGDTSTLADPSLVDDLIEGRRNRVMKIVAADIGGTHARFALAELAPGELPRLGAMRKYRTREHDGPRLGLGGVRARLRRALPRAAALAVAAPIEGEILTFMNSDWRIARRGAGRRSRPRPAHPAQRFRRGRPCRLGAAARTRSMPIMGPDAPFPRTASPA